MKSDALIWARSNGDVGGEKTDGEMPWASVTTTETRFGGGEAKEAPMLDGEAKAAICFGSEMVAMKRLITDFRGASGSTSTYIHHKFEA